MELLTKMRQVNKLLQKTGYEPIDFMKMAEVLSENIRSNVLILDEESNIVGVAAIQEIKSERLQEMYRKSKVPESYTKETMKISETQANIGIESDLTLFPVELRGEVKEAWTTIIPVRGGGEHLGSLILGRLFEKFGEDELILGEYASTLIGMEILRVMTGKVEEETRKRSIAHLAFDSLSYTEVEAIGAILAEMGGKDGLLVASKIADKSGITRSVIVNAIRKLESAGVLESRSLGMKGTYIKIHNEEFVEQFESWHKK